MEHIQMIFYRVDIFFELYMMILSSGSNLSLEALKTALLHILRRSRLTSYYFNK